MGFPLYVTCCFSLAAFNILSLCLVFISLISLCLLGFILYGTLCASWTWSTFLFLFGEIFNYNLFKKFLIPFLFLFSFWVPYNSNFSAFDIVPEVSEAILSSFHSFYFILPFRSCFHHLTSSSLICSFASDILQLIPSSIFLTSVIVLFVAACLFFNFSRSLLIDSYIFSILLSRFWIIFISLFWILFQEVCLFPLHLFVLLCF